MNINREHVREKFDEYVSRYDISDVKVRLKQEHTYYVADNCERIARSLGLNGSDIDLAWLLGMFHDIGRFEQLRRFHTFLDGISVNHAALSAELLFQNGLIKEFLEDYSREERLMERAVRLHNVYHLPANLTERERMFADILRDADKIDIFRVNCETPRSEIYNLPEEAFLTSDITEEVYQQVISHQEVDRRYSKTGVDYILGHIGFVYGLVFPESKKIVRQQGYLKQLLAFHSDNPKTQAQLKKVRSVIAAYLNEEERVSETGENA